MGGSERRRDATLDDIREGFAQEKLQEDFYGYVFLCGFGAIFMLLHMTHDVVFVLHFYVSIASICMSWLLPLDSP